MQDWSGLAEHFALNAAIFIGFFFCATAHHWIVHKKAPTVGESGWHALLAGVFSPATFDALREFLVHLVVYSGYLIPKH